MQEGNTQEAFDWLKGNIYGVQIAIRYLLDRSEEADKNEIREHLRGVANYAGTLTIEAEALDNAGEHTRPFYDGLRNSIAEITKYS